MDVAGEDCGPPRVHGQTQNGRRILAARANDNTEYMYVPNKKNCVNKSDMKIRANAAGLALTEWSSQFSSHVSLSWQKIIIISCMAGYRKPDQGFVGLYNCINNIQSFPGLFLFSAPPRFAVTLSKYSSGLVRGMLVEVGKYCCFLVCRGFFGGSRQFDRACPGPL